jgi:hypothetical protein
VSHMRRILVYWLPVAVWMALIFTGSADSQSAERSSKYLEPLVRWLFPGLSIDGVHWTMLMVRKCAHLAEYALLAVLTWRALRGPKAGTAPSWRWSHAGLALLVVVVYAVSDELHQSTVPTRQGTALDVVIDTAGGLLGLAGVWVLQKRRLRGEEAKPVAEGRRSALPELPPGLRR